MLNRRKFLRSAAAVALTRSTFAPAAATLNHKERVDLALRGKDLDRPPFTFYLHYKRPNAHAEALDHLEFHRLYNTDIVKVMNDFDYPSSTSGRWYDLKPIDSPYPQQLETLRLVRDGLKGDAYFIDTLYGPYMTAMILFQSQPQFSRLGQSQTASRKVIAALRQFQQRQPDHWHAALEAITQSTVNHIHRSRDTGTSGTLVSIFNSHTDYGSVADYRRLSRPYDKRVLDALAGTPLTVLHLHNLDRPYLDQFTDFNAPVLQYSIRTSGIPISEARKLYSQTIAGGVDEIDFRKLTAQKMREQWRSARTEAGSRYLATPGCSVPNSCTPDELARFPQALGA